MLPHSPCCACCACLPTCGDRQRLLAARHRHVHPPLVKLEVERAYGYRVGRTRAKECRPSAPPQRCHELRPGCSAAPRYSRHELASQGHRAGWPAARGGFAARQPCTRTHRWKTRRPPAAVRGGWQRPWSCAPAQKSATPTHRSDDITVDRPPPVALLPLAAPLAAPINAVVQSAAGEALAWFKWFKSREARNAKYSSGAPRGCPRSHRWWSRCAPRTPP